MGKVNKKKILRLLPVAIIILSICCNSEKTNEINSVKDFYVFIDHSKNVPDNFERTKLITKQLSGLSERSIINFEKIFRKELIRVCHYNIALLYELAYPSPVFTKNGTPVKLPGDAYLSTDGFIYFRCGVLLLGEKTVNQLLEDPAGIMKMDRSLTSIDAEGMLYCATDALKNKGSKVNLDDSLDISENYDVGNYSMSGKKNKMVCPGGRISGTSQFL